MTDRERAKKAYEGTPAYNAGRKDAIEEIRDYINKYVTLDTQAVSLKLVCEKVAEMCRSV